MDPLTAVGAVASVIQLAQTALSLSKTLYSLGAAVASASEDIQLLAQDLKTFSQSLTILSRLLEDSKSWYSDDIYLLTARIIKDCAELYVKIDKILAKLGSNGKSTWKLRVKFVYKEGQIKKLMKRLRDMKGTLATILMSLQVDLQLSLFPSKIQRLPEIPLQPETIETLRKAQEAVKAVDLLPRYSETRESQANLQEFIQTGHSSYQTRETAHGMHETISPSPQSAALREMHSNGTTPSQVFDLHQSFVVLPSTAQVACAQTREQNAPSSASRDVHSGVESKSIKSSSSIESFKSAISMQQKDLDVAHQVKAVRAVMHAFHTALQILDNLIERRMRSGEGDVYHAAKDLQNVLCACSKDINGSHIANFKLYGLGYIEKFTAKNTTKLQENGSIIMREIVMKLHEFSAEHEDLSKPGFDKLQELAKKFSCQILTFLNQLTPSQEDTLRRQFYMEAPVEFDAAPMPCSETKPKFQDRKQKTGERVKKPVKCRSTSSDSNVGLKTFHYRMVQSSTPRKDAPELSLPFVGYTFKRFETYPRKDGAIIPIPISTPQISTRSNVTATDRDLTCVPDLNDDVLKDFDFDSFLQQDGDSSKFELPADESGFPSTASRRPYTPVHCCNTSFKITKGNIENKHEESDKACDACIAHSAKCDAARPTCINCYANELECKYEGQICVEKQDDYHAIEEKPPIFINAKQFHRILKRRAARQALKEEQYSRNQHATDQFKQRTTENKDKISESHVSCLTTIPITNLLAHTQGDRASPPQQKSNNHTPSHQIPLDTHQAWHSPHEKRVRSLGASARFHERRKAKERVMIEQAMKDRDNGTIKSSENPPEESTTLHQSIHHISLATSASSRLPDEKPIGSASARFRARRKAKEREIAEQAIKNRDEATKSIEIRLDTPTASHQAIHDLSPQNLVKSYDPYATISLAPLTRRAPKIHSYDPHEADSRSENSLSLSPSQEIKLWWRSLAFTRLSNFNAFQVLRFEFATELSVYFDFAIDDEMLCKRVSSDIKHFEERNLRRKSQAEGFNEVLEMRMNILRIIFTVDEQLGLQIAILGWSCVCTVLHVYDHILGENPGDALLISTLTNAYTQLQEIVAIVARYTVMENLYHQSGSTLSLKSEYRSSLLYLCSTILEYFSVSLTLGRTIRKIGTTVEERQRIINSCEQLMLSVREKDQACQRFQVVVEAKEESRSESDEIEDVSDDSWEEVLAPSSDDDLINLDAALV